LRERDGERGSSRSVYVLLSVVVLNFHTPSPSLVPAGAHKNLVRPFGGTNVHRTFVKTPPHLPRGEREASRGALRAHFV